MNSHLRFVVLPLVLGLAACAAEYSKSEAPDTLRVDGSESRLSIAFAGGSDHLAAGEAARLDRMVVAGAIRPADRVEIAASGPPGLAERRAAAISRELLRYGIVTQTVALEAVPANHALVSVGRFAVTLPTCPNWSQSQDYDFTNAYTSNYGCANTTNLGLMVASPGDLVSGRQLSGGNATVASAAVQRYLTDRVKPPPAVTASPFGGGGGGGDQGGGAPPAGGAPGAAP
jgi:pilus assembly protein CpaD